MILFFYFIDFFPFYLQSRTALHTLVYHRSSSLPVMHFHRVATLLLICSVAASYAGPRREKRDIAAVEKAIEAENLSLIKAGENDLPAPAKKIAEAEVAFAQGLEKDVMTEEKKLIGKEKTLNNDLVSMFQGGLETLETGKISFGPAKSTFKDIMAIDADIEKDAMAEGKKLVGHAKKIVAAEMEAGKSEEALLQQEAGQAMKIGKEVFKADQALAADLVKEEGQLLSGNFDTSGLVKGEENFAKTLAGAEQEAIKDAQMDVKAAIKA